MLKDLVLCFTAGLTIFVVLLVGFIAEAVLTVLGAPET